MNTETILNAMRPSGAARWTVCTASPRYIAEHIKLIPPEKPEAWVTEGKEAHFLAESMLRGYPRSASAYHEKFTPVWDYVQRCDDISHGGLRFVEYQVRIPYTDMPWGKGTLDFGHVDFNTRTLTVRDLKFGVGTPIHAMNNKQLALYAYALGNDVEAEAGWKVIIEIDQVRLPEGVSRWEIKWEDLKEFFYQMNVKAGIAYNGKGTEFVACEDTCRKCPAKALCTARSGELVSETPLAGAFPQADTLTPEHLARIVLKAKDLRKWLDDVEEAVQARMATGEAFPGLKLVDGRGSRGWSDKAVADRYLKSRLGAARKTIPELISPAQAERLLKAAGKLNKEALAGLITTTVNSKNIVPADDKRPALVVDVGFYDETLL
jgi:hypothetical protein